MFEALADGAEVEELKALQKYALTPILAAILASGYAASNHPIHVDQVTDLAEQFIACSNNR